MSWAPDYVTTAEVKAFVRVGDTVDDTEIALIASSVSRQIDLACNRQFGVVGSVEERFYTARWDRRRCRWVIEIDDIMTTTGLDPQVQDAEGVDRGAIDDYVLEPRNAAQRGRPWTAMVVRPNATMVPTGLQDECAFTGLWGWTAVPSAAKVAARLQCSRILSRRDSPYGIAGSPDQGSELRLLAKLDPDVEATLKSYIRWWGAK